MGAIDGDIQLPRTYIIWRVDVNESSNSTTIMGELEGGDRGVDPVIMTHS